MPANVRSIPRSWAVQSDVVSALLFFLTLAKMFSCFSYSSRVCPGSCRLFISILSPKKVNRGVYRYAEKSICPKFGGALMPARRL